MLLLFLFYIFIGKTNPASIAAPTTNVESNHPHLPIDQVYPPELKRFKRALEEGAKLWPEGKIIYKIDGGFTDDNDIRRIHIAAKALSDATCIKFINQTKENEKKPYVQIFKFVPKQYTSACVAEIGFKNRHPQWTILTPKTCYGNTNKYSGVAAHELMHTLGFLHEFQRPDRRYYLDDERINEFLRVESLPGYTGNLTFDYKSITQYEAGYVFRQPTKPRPPEYPEPIGDLTDMGHLCYISAQDRTLIDKVYAKECKLRNPKVYKDPFVIPGTGCKGTVHYKDDEAM